METLRQKQIKMDLLFAMEQIVKEAKDSQLSTEFYQKAATYIEYVSTKLELTNEQSVMMSLFIDNCNNANIHISDIGMYVGCRPTSMLRYMFEIEVLERRELVCCNRSNFIRSYRVPLEVTEAFRRDEKYEPANCGNFTPHQFFEMIEEIFEMRYHCELKFKIMCEKINRLLDSNMQLIFVQKLKSYGFNEDDELLLILFSHLFVNHNDDNIGCHDISFMYGREERIHWNIIKRELNDGSHFLLQTKMIEYNNDSGFVNRESFRMTWQAKTELFAELNLTSMNEQNKKGDMLMVENIVEKKLFYDTSIQRQITELGLLLEENHYQEIRSRMKESGFRCGFTCLFYGAPGTGKTEAVLQLARMTGRDIMQVNISKIKSMWVGESEKNIQSIFDCYRRKVLEYKLTPILLFNESDAVIGKRQEGAERAVEKMENSIQNIILQEMETLDGILIATTNLVQNMDKAFERRFLYKIKFNNPTVETRMSIWQEMVPALADSQARTLAMKYDFSGGQIENVARHYAIDNILHGDQEDILKTLIMHCNTERLDKTETRKIGFTPRT